MPELPEVETARRIIIEELEHKAIASVVVRLPKLLRFSPIPTLDALIGREVVAARRRAKILIVDFSHDLSLVIHLKLAGQIAVHLPDGTRRMAGHPVPKPDGDYPHKSTHIEFHFAGGEILYLSDIRQFGWLRLLPTEDVEALIATFKLGVEAVGADSITIEALTAKLTRRSIPIKLALLDQGVIGGIGSIHVDEALHRARIHPATPANSLDAVAIERLLGAVTHALDSGIEQGGAKIVHSKAYPIDGFPAVHAREGEACPACGATIVKTRVGTRGTYLCPTCQPTPESFATDENPTAV